MNMDMTLGKTGRTLTAIAALMMMSACGQSTGDRALSGGAIGAGVGAVGASVLAADPVTGALLGGAVGAATGAATDSNDINLD